MSRDQLTFSRSTTVVGSAKVDIKRSSNLNDAELAHEFKALVSPLKTKQDCDEILTALAIGLDCETLEGVEDIGADQTTCLHGMEPNFQILSQQLPVQFQAQGFRHRLIEAQNELKNILEKNIRADISEPGNRKLNGAQLQKQVANQPSDLTKTTSSFDKQWLGFAQEPAFAGFGENLAGSGFGVFNGVQIVPTAQITVASNRSGMALKNVQIETITKNATGKLTSIELALEPAELGRITARLELSQDRLVLQVTVENRQAAELLAQDSGLLLRALSHYIGSVENMSVIIRQDGQELGASGHQDMASLHSKQQRNDNLKSNEQPVPEQNYNETSHAGGAGNGTIRAGILI